MNTVLFSYVGEGHIPCKMKKIAGMMKKIASPNCEESGVVEDIQHLLMECVQYESGKKFTIFATICVAEMFIQDPYNIDMYCQLTQGCVPDDTPVCGVDEKQQITAEFKNYCILFGVNCFKRQGLFIENDYETCIKNATKSFSDRVLYYGKLTEFYMTGPFIAQKKKKNLDPHQENMLKTLIKLVS